VGPRRSGRGWLGWLWPEELRKLHELRRGFFQRRTEMVGPRSRQLFAG
jgi:hypothetical protein